MSGSDNIAQACQSLRIRVLTMGGKELTAVTALEGDTVQDLKQKVERAAGIPAIQIRLFHGVEEMAGASLLREVGLPADGKVFMVNQGMEGVVVQSSVRKYDGDSVADAAQAGALEDVLRLIQEGADVNARGSYGYTALHHMAAVPGCMDGAYVDISPEAAAIAMQWLLEKRADVNQGDNGGKTPLHVLGKYGGRMQQLRVLLDAGADANRAMSHGEGWTPLWYVRNYRRPIWRDLEAALLQQGAEQRPDRLEHPLPEKHPRVFAGTAELTEAVATEGAEAVVCQLGVASYAGRCVADAAAAGALGDVVRLVQEGADVNARGSDYGYTALHHMAAVPGCMVDLGPEAAAIVMVWLLEKRADVNQGDSGGKTPLHVLGKYGGHTQQLRALLDAGADVNRAMNYGAGWTPLWYVRNYRRPIWRDLEAALLERGAEQIPTILDNPLPS